MPGGNRRAKRPIHYVSHGQWPYARMNEQPGARIAQAVSRALAEAMERGGWSANELAAEADINRQVITNVLSGTTWPDLYTIAHLEDTLGVILWPDHLSWPAEGQPADGGALIGPQREPRTAPAAAARRASRSAPAQAGAKPGEDDAAGPD